MARLTTFFAHRRQDASQGASDHLPSGTLSAPAAEADVERLEPGAGAEHKPSGMRTSLETLGAVIAPVTVLTALAYYFGWKRTSAFAEYFGIDHSTLSFSTQDYVLRSADPLLIPLGATLTIALLALSIHRFMTLRLAHSSDSRSLRWITLLLISLGLLLFIFGAVAAIAGWQYETPYLVAPLSPGIGIALLSYGTYLWRRLDKAQDARKITAPIRHLSPSLTVGIVVAIMLLSAFWTVSEYANALGRGRARDFAATLSSQPEVVLHSRERLHLGYTRLGVIETRLQLNNSGYRFRYSGLRLLIRNGEKYFLVPGLWSREDGVVMILRDDDSVRIEFRMGAIYGSAD